MAIGPIPPSTSEPEPEALPPATSSHTFLTGNASIRSMAVDGVTHTSDTPLPLRTQVDAAILSNWNQPQPQQPQRPPFLFHTPPGAPPFPPPIQADAEMGDVSAGSSTASATGSTATEAADTARFEGQVTTVRTVIIRTVLSNQPVVQLTALSLLNELSVRIETLRVDGSRSNSEMVELDDLKTRVEEFLDANANRKEASIADSAIAIANGLRSLFRHENVRNIGLLGVGLSFCAAAGALHVSDTVILAVSAIAGGKNVADVINAAANLVWGKNKDS